MQQPYLEKGVVSHVAITDLFYVIFCFPQAITMLIGVIPFPLKVSESRNYLYLDLSFTKFVLPDIQLFSCLRLCKNVLNGNHLYNYSTKPLIIPITHFKQFNNPILEVI